MFFGATSKTFFIIGCFFIWLSFSSWAQAQILLPEVFQGNLSLSQSIEWHLEPEDNKGAIDWQQAEHWQNWQAVTDPQIGMATAPIWTRLILNNPSHLSQTLILYHPQAFTENITLYLLYKKDKTLETIEQYHLGSNTEVIKQPIPHRLSTVTFSIPAQSSLTIYSRIETVGPLNLDWYLADTQSFSRKSLPETLLYGMFAGFILYLIIYHLLLSRKVHNPLLWSYIGFALLTLIYQLVLKGLVRFEPFAIDSRIFTVSLSFLPFLILFMLTLFSMQLFNFSARFPKVQSLLRLVLFTYLALFSFYFSAYFFDAIFDYWVFGFYTAIIGAVVPFALGWFTIKQKLEGAYYFFIGQSALMIGHIMQSSVMLGWLPINSVTDYAIPLAFVIDLLLLSMVFSNRIAHLQSTYQRQRQMLIAQSRLTLMGQTFGTISHEWRVPIVRLGSQLTELETVLWHPGTIDKKTLIAKSIPKMHVSLQTLIDTVERFRQFFEVDHQPESFKINDKLKQIFHLLQGKQAWSMTQLQIHSPKELTILSYPSHFSQVMMLILDRALSLCAQTQGQYPVMVLHIQAATPSNLSIRFRVPQPGLVKDTSEHLSTLQLDIARVVIEDKLQGQLVYLEDQQLIEIEMTLPYKLSGVLQ